MDQTAAPRLWIWTVLLLCAAAVRLGSAQSAPAISNDTANGDRTLLMGVKRGIDNWNDFSSANGIQGWTDSTPICQWTGILCSPAGRVVGINLGCYGCSRQAIGGLSPAVANFMELQEIDFSHQFLAGSLPAAWGSGGVLQQLRSLNLASNQFTGCLPESWGSPGAFPVLKTLTLSGNQLTGTLPPSWGSLGSFASTQILDLQHNKLFGTLPEEWGDDAWQNLTELYLGSNLNLTGPVPDGWVVDSGFDSLEVMSLTNNQLTGELPPGLGQPPGNLRTLDFSFNLFSGTLQSDWSGPGTANTSSILLNGCLLEGELPESWGDPDAFGMLQTLDLSQNHLSGRMPISWGFEGSFPVLSTLNLQQNWLNHDLTYEWGYSASFPSLQSLLLSYNAFRSTLPSSWGSNGSFSMLSNLDVSANYLTGTLPASWGEVMPDLSYLNLTWNRFYGTIPAEWASAESLTETLVSPGNYQLCGSLPAGSKAMLCKDLGDGCNPLQSLGQTCSLTPPCQAQYIPPAFTNTSMQAILRLYSSPQPATNQFLMSSLTSALLYIMTTAESAQIIQLVEPGSSIYSYSSSDTSGRRLLDQPLFVGEAQSQHRLMQAGGPSPTPVGPAAAPGPDSLVPGIVDAVLQFTAISGGSVLRMEEQLVTVLGSQALVNVLNASHAGVTGVELVSVEPASPSEVPAWWKPIEPYVPTDSNARPSVQGAAVGAPAAGTPPQDDDDDDDGVQSNPEDHDLPVGVIVGVSVAACLVVAMVAAALFVIRRKRRNRQGALELTTSTEGYGSKARDLQNPPQVVYGIPHQPSLPGRQSGSLASEASAVAALSRRQSTTQEAELDGLLQDPGASALLTLPQMPWSDWEIKPEEIEICTRPSGELWELGSGSFGKVYKAVRAASEPVAVKVLHAGEGGPAFGNEIALLKACRHSNIVQFQGACLQGGRVMLVTELMEGGDLFRALSSPHARKMLAWRCCGRKVAMDIARGLHFLHSHRVVHLDLKSHNILLSREGTAKITDVGLSKIVQGSCLSQLDDVVGTFAYAAPELLLGVRCTERVDCYAFGVLVWEIATGERPQRGQLRDVRVPDELPEDVEALRQQCMDPDPANRPSAKEIYDRLAASSQ